VADSWRGGGARAHPCGVARWPEPRVHRVAHPVAPPPPPLATVVAARAPRTGLGCRHAAGGWRGRPTRGVGRALVLSGRAAGVPRGAVTRPVAIEAPIPSIGAPLGMAVGGHGQSAGPESDRVAPHLHQSAMNVCSRLSRRCIILSESDARVRALTFLPIIGRMSTQSSFKTIDEMKKLIDE